ncbi:MAG: alpha/beta fold hydrolase [Actinomycetia bacterium]|nr:alpha/beta fold hydrolase [Actinomycetes bacterium]
MYKHLRRFAKGTLVTTFVFIASVAVTQACLLLRFLAAKRRGVPEGRPEHFEPPERRSMADSFERVEQVPFQPVRPMALGFVRGALSNSFLPFMNARRSTTGRMYAYPGEFEDVVIESFDGTPIQAVVGIHPDGGPRPALVISHGFMGSKNDHYVIDTALTAYSEWGFNVLGVDLRNFGRSQCITHTPSTAGWKEGEDLLAAAKYLSEKPEVTTVGITGFSMGAGSTMRAAFMAREYPYLTGGAIAWNGYSDARRMVEYISKRPPVGDRFMPVYLAFRLMHRLRRKDMIGYIEDPKILDHLHGKFQDANFMMYMEKVAAPHYGVTVDELYRNASPREFLADVEVPLLIVHSADDPICPPSEMDELMEIAEDNPNVHVWMLPAGNHCMFQYFDRNWYLTTMRDFFSYWADWGEDDVPGDMAG